MKSSLTNGPSRKKLSQVCLRGEIMRSFPRARTSTFFTVSGRRNSAGSRTACVRLLVKIVVMAIFHPLCIWQKYIALMRKNQAILTFEGGNNGQLKRTSPTKGSSHSKCQMRKRKPLNHTPRSRAELSLDSPRCFESTRRPSQALNKVADLNPHLILTKIESGPAELVQEALAKLQAMIE